MNLVQAYAEAIAAQHAQLLDEAVGRAIRRASPFAHWLVTRFPYGITGKFLRLVIHTKHNPLYPLSQTFEVWMRGKRIEGPATIETPVPSHIT
jgi:hypothetical protein